MINDQNIFNEAIIQLFINFFQHFTDDILVMLASVFLQQHFQNYNFHTKRCNY